MVKNSSGQYEYLTKFLEYVVKQMTEYSNNLASGTKPNWKAKEALMDALGEIRDEIWKDDSLKGQMEEMLSRFVLSELNSEEQFMRLRACQTYGVYGDIHFKDQNHVTKIVEGICANMQEKYGEEDQPLPVKFHAACALQKILMNKTAQDHVRPSLDGLLKCYLSLMNEFDNEELVQAFERVMTIFQKEIKPWAIQIVQHLQHQYVKCVNNEDDEDEESILTAVASFTSIRRIITIVEDDPAIM